MSFYDELLHAYRQYMHTRRIPLIALRYDATAYPPAQLKQATRVAARLDRGLFFLAVEPEDG